MVSEQIGFHYPHLLHLVSANPGQSLYEPYSGIDRSCQVNLRWNRQARILLRLWLEPGAVGDMYHVGRLQKEESHLAR